MTSKLFNLTSLPTKVVLALIAPQLTFYTLITLM